MNFINIINIIGIITATILITIATVLLLWKSKPKQKPVNCLINYKKIYETDDEVVFVEENGDEFHLKK